MAIAYYEYLSFRDAELFTVVCLPQKTGKFPTVIIRKPYVDEEEALSEETICENKLQDHTH